MLPGFIQVIKLRFYNLAVYFSAMSIPGTHKRINILVTTGVWILLGFIMLLVQPLTWGVRIPAVFFVKQLGHFVLMISIYYLNARLVAPRTLFRNKIWLFVLWVITATCFSITINELLSSLLHVFDAMVKAIGHLPPKRKSWGIDFFAIMSTLMTLGVSTSVAAFSRWQRDALLREELEKEKVRSELSFLKAQINPHFFFNTLNNIYSLSFIDVPASQDALHKLSRMMRYLLYETQNDTTLLSKELAFVRDYIQLMKLRMQASTRISYLEPQQYEDIQVAPMLLLPYIENAFKHGISATGRNDIHMEISVAGRQLTMKVENVIHRSNHIEQALQEGSGIGLQNTLRRLELLYPGKFSLDIREGAAGELYSVVLKIDLS